MLIKLCSSDEAGILLGSVAFQNKIPDTDNIFGKVVFPVFTLNLPPSLENFSGHYQIIQFNDEHRKILFKTHVPF